MKNMGKSELDNFIIKMTIDAAYKDALILDIRYNRGGGNFDDPVLFSLDPCRLCIVVDGAFHEIMFAN